MIKSLQRNHIYYIVEKDFLQIDRSVPFVSDASDDPCTSTSLVIYGGRYQAKGDPHTPTDVTPQESQEVNHPFLPNRLVGVIKKF